MEGEVNLPDDFYGTGTRHGNTSGARLAGALVSLETAGTVRERRTSMRSVGFPVRERRRIGILFLRLDGADGRASDAGVYDAAPPR
jgi:hypothetical protein